jgi:hypothetical protein
MKTKTAAWVELMICCCGMFDFSGCASKLVDPQTAAVVAVDAATGGDTKETRRDHVPLYRSGPGQMMPADDRLAAHTRVKIMRTQFGYSFVDTESGESGWVANEDLEAAKPEEIPTVAANNVTPTALPVMGTGRNALAEASNDWNPDSANTEIDKTKSIETDTAIVARYTTSNRETENQRKKKDKEAINGTRGTAGINDAVAAVATTPASSPSPGSR